MMVQPDRIGSITRRDFIRYSAAGSIAATALAAFPSGVHAAGSDRLRVGLIGCGGRGTGAARDAVLADPATDIVAMGDLFGERIAQSRSALADAVGDALKVTDEQAFVGFDSYLRVLEADVDLVILATPPAFRPIHFEAATRAGVHVFMEKPCAVDVAGIRQVIAAGEVAREKNLSVVAGTVYRRQPSFIEGVRRIHDGLIGPPLSVQAYYLTGALREFERTAAMSDMEWQIRAWWYYTWMSGDHIVEQFVHNLDVVNWVLRENPASCLGMGGRIERVNPAYDVYDQFSVEYQYSGARVEAKCRQIGNAARRVTNRVLGTDGVAVLDPEGTWIHSHSGQLLYEHTDLSVNPYVQQHAVLAESIRNGSGINEARQLAESTLVGIMGRESAYTGRELTWAEIESARLDLVPEHFAFGDTPFPQLAIPGRTPLDRSPWDTA